MRLLLCVLSLSYGVIVLARPASPNCRYLPATCYLIEKFSETEAGGPVMKVPMENKGRKHHASTRAKYKVKVFLRKSSVAAITAAAPIIAEISDGKSNYPRDLVKPGYYLFLFRYTLF